RRGPLSKKIETDRLRDATSRPSGPPRPSRAIRAKAEVPESKAAMTERLVVIGNGMAAGRVLETLLDEAPGRFDVTVFGAEPRANYNRILLSPVLSGEKSFPEIVTHTE